MATIFTKIIKGEIPCYQVFEDEKTFAFLDIHPETAGHVLVVPKEPVDKVYELSTADYNSLFLTVKRIAIAMEKVFSNRTLMKVIGTDVPHAHVHLMPFDETWEHGRQVQLSEAEMTEIARKIAKAVREVPEEDILDEASEEEE